MCGYRWEFMSTDHDVGYGWSRKQEEGEKEVVRLLYKLTTKWT